MDRLKLSLFLPNINSHYTTEKSNQVDKTRTPASNKVPKLRRRTHQQRIEELNKLIKEAVKEIKVDVEIEFILCRLYKPKINKEKNLELLLSKNSNYCQALCYKKEIKFRCYTMYLMYLLMNRQCIS